MNARNSKRGVAKFDQDKGRLRIALPMGLVKNLKNQGYEVKRYNYTGLEATPQNEVKVAQIVEMMNQDLSNPQMAFDPTLSKYLDLLKPKVSSNGKTFVLGDISAITIGRAWDDWLDIKKPQVEASTFITRYGRYSSFLKPFKELPINQETATKIVSYLQNQIDSGNAKQCFSQLKQAVSFKVDNGDVASNPFNYYKNPIKTRIKTKKISDEDDIKVFSKEDMEVIIQAFCEHPKCVDYAPLVEFLFLTGLYVFSVKGQPIKHHNLSSRWGSRDKNQSNNYPNIVLNLAKEGKIKQYLKPYAMRHTYMSIAANMIAEKYPKEQFLSALQLLADSVGNTIEVISKHYLHITEDVILPSFD